MYGMYRLLLGSINFYKIFEHSQKHCDRTLICGKYLTKAPQNIGINWRTWSLGFVNLHTTTATLPTAVYYLCHCTIFVIHIWYVVWKTWRMGSKHRHNFRQDVKSMCAPRPFQLCKGNRKFYVHSASIGKISKLNCVSQQDSAMKEPPGKK
jgi:hypothetical protein